MCEIGMEIASSGEPDSGNEVTATLLKGFLCVIHSVYCKLAEYVFYVVQDVAAAVRHCKAIASQWINSASNSNSFHSI